MRYNIRERILHCIIDVTRPHLAQGCKQSTKWAVKKLTEIDAYKCHETAKLFLKNVSAKSFLCDETRNGFWICYKCLKSATGGKGGSCREKII